MSLIQHLMSFHDADSDLGRINRSAIGVPVTIHPWTARVLRHAQAHAAVTRGLQFSIENFSRQGNAGGPCQPDPTTTRASLRTRRTISAIASGCASASIAQARMHSATTSCWRWRCFRRCRGATPSRWRRR
ncbi:hypothetical protein EAV90_11345 [Bradyrhizobium vignae]|nr:hypothetical protein EAV90_11345 [Bradyrhizobium vignae]